MYDDPDYQPQPVATPPHHASAIGQEPAWISVAAAGELTNRWPLHGDPVRLIAAAAVLRTGDPEKVFGAKFPGEYVMTGVARLLEALAHKIRERVDLGYDVVSAATEIAEHALVYVPRDETQR